MSFLSNKADIEPESVDLQPQPKSLFSNIGQAMKKFVLANIEAPLPLLPARHRISIKTPPLPKFTFNDSGKAEPLGQINGRPLKEVFQFETDLLQYLKEAY